MMHTPLNQEQSDQVYLQQQMEALRRERDAAYQLLDQLPVLIYHYDIVEQRSLYRNREVVAMLGYSAKEMQDMSENILALLMHPDDYTRYQHYMATLLQTAAGEITEFEYRMRHKDGSWRWILSRDVVIARGADGTPQQVIGTAHDITERKQAENDMLTFRTLVEGAPYSITISSLEGFLTYANPAHQQAHGYEGSAAGIRFDQIMPDADALNAALGVLTSEGRWQGIMPHKHADGTTFPMQCDAFFVYDQAGTPISAVVIERDVSEEVRQEQEHHALQQQIIDAQQTAIRELSTPLLPISKHVVVMPLVGTIDSQRAQQVMEALLEGISAYRATTVIIDITGVRVVDTQVAQALLQSAQAARLLGAQVFLTGIQPQIAQTLVGLGVDLSGIQTQGSLQAGIASALRQ
jgi:anti-anti-sigma factor